TYFLMARSTIQHIRDHAAQDDEGRFAILVLTVLAALASLAAIVAELGIGEGGKRTGTQLALATVTIFLSWTFIHTIFALNYAHDYYGEHRAKSSGLQFPDDADPDYWDFVYFSFVVGMTCQVSDVAVASQPIRRTVIAHGVASFLFNTALLALPVNIAASAICRDGSGWTPCPRNGSARDRPIVNNNEITMTAPILKWHKTLKILDLFHAASIRNPPR